MRPRRPLPLALLLSLLPAAFACRSEPPVDDPRQAPGSDLVTEEVAPPPDHLVDPSTDVREKRRAPRVAGVMPSDFPTDLPLPEGGSLTDFSDGEGRAWVELTVPRPVAEVRRSHGARLTAAGWEGTPGQEELRKGGRTAEVEYSATGPSSRVRIHYQS